MANGTIQGATGGIRSAAIASRFPVVDGLDAGTTTQEGREEALTPTEKSLVLEERKKGI